MLTSVGGGLNDPWLQAKAGKPMTERSTDELLELLDHFYPKFRGYVAKELGERFTKGEEGIQARLIDLLGSDNARYREGALLALGASGSDAVLSNLSKVTVLLNDPKDFVRISAAKVVSKATETEETQLAMLKATVDKPDALAPNAVRNTTQNTLFGKDTPLANDPFNAGFDEELVEKALEEVILLDPAGKTFMAGRKDKWSKDTVIRMAGPLTYAAEEEQVGDQMFANRSAPAQALLGKFGYAEAILATAHRLRKKAAIRRDIQPFVGYKRPLIDPNLIDENPAAFFGLVGEMETVLVANPIQQIQKNVGNRRNPKMVDIPLETFYRKIKAQKKATVMPSIADDAKKQFLGELDALDGTGAKLKLCRKILSDPTRKDFFRKIAAMDFLEEAMGPDAMEDLLPYLRHDDWRLKAHSREIASELIASGAGSLLISHYAKTFEASTKAGILEVLANSGEKGAMPIVNEALKDEAPIVRQAAVESLAKLGGKEVVPEILAHLKTATDKEEMIGCETALLSFQDNVAIMGKTRSAIVAMLPEVGFETRSSIYYILSRIGDKESISALRTALETDDYKEFDDIIFALSYSPSREADKVMLDMAASDSRTAKIVGAYSMRRMVIGPKGYGDLTTDQKMDFAEAMLKMALDRKLIQYLGQVYEARALRALMYCLEKGVESAADSLVACAEGMESLSAKDAKIAAQSLQDVIEYIEVTRLRGGIKAHMDKDDKYLEWKALQARAGKVLLKVHKPEEAPIPEFDPLEFE
jgi:HEAT repeat protein